MLSWSKICRPKSAGGLGLRKMEPVNQAFLAKLGWKVLTDHNNLWVKLIRQTYLSRTNFWEYKYKPSDSCIWKKILKSRSLLSQGIRWKIGDGVSTLFWLDNWVMNRNLASFLQIFSLDPSACQLKVAVVIRGERKWDLEMLK